MYRFFCRREDAGADTIIVRDPGEVRHMKNVLRLQPGDEVTVFDEEGTAYGAAILDFTTAGARLAVKTRTAYAPRFPRLTVACALAKNAKMDDIVDKLTQLGVERIIPLNTGRVIVKWDARKASAHHKRWQMIASGACKQSGCGRVPFVDPVRTFTEVITRAADFDAVLIPTLEGDRAGLGTIMNGRAYKNILVCIGPEGDFTPQEISRAREAGCIPVTLGRNVLRVDTAAVAVAAVIMLASDT